MNNMQKEYVMKWLKGLGIAVWVILIFCSAGMGEPWHWFAIISLTVIIAPLIFAAFYVPIALLVWYWRLMGVCETEAEENVLEAWWFWIRRSDNWRGYLTEDIYERYPEEDDYDSRYILLTFLDKLDSAKKPKWL